MNEKCWRFNDSIVTEVQQHVVFQENSPSQPSDQTADILTWTQEINPMNIPFIKRRKYPIESGAFADSEISTQE
jgi:hypothetical protein